MAEQDDSGSGRSNGSGLREVVLVSICALATVVIFDRVLVRITPVLPDRLEVSHGVAAYQDSDPDTLVLGSSHARAFGVLAKRLAEQKKGEHVLVQMPVEFGKHSSYRWVVENRLRPLIEEQDDSGKLVRPSLSRVLIVTEWWDGCQVKGGETFNIPSRAWTLADFLGDAASNGLTPYNQNYITRRFNRLLPGSILVQDRGVGRLPRALLGKVRPVSEEAKQADWQQRIDFWHTMVEGAATDPLCRNGEELKALREIVAYFGGRGVEVTLILFARMPSTLTPKALETTFPIYEKEIRQVAADAGDLRVIDMTRAVGLGDEHFMSDFDHTTAEGNRRIAEWGLAGPLRFLLEPPTQTNEATR